ncbi:MAG: anhydro-N-acetylmuramic acid kinase [Alphaproteobacteria bacterium]
MPEQSYTAIGMMSGTSMDGIDVALIHTDGRRGISFGPALTVAYDAAFGARLRALPGDGDIGDEITEAARALTLRHVDAIDLFCEKFSITRENIDVIGFHGQTILHRPDAGRTWQIGDGALLAARTGIAVIDDFRSRDVAAGGQGAPLAPGYHAALCAGLPRPVAVLNIGGVANVTWVGADLDPNAGEGLLAFDTGPGNALIDDWMQDHGGAAMDADGALAARGKPDEGILARLLVHPYFRDPPPKSLDRDDFSAATRRATRRLDAADGAATLTAFTAASVALAVDHLPASPRRWIVTGGGRHNPTLMAALRERLAAEVVAAEALRWNGDALEAQAFAYLAVRGLRGLPLTFPSTTGAPRPLTGGTLHRPGEK